MSKLSGVLLIVAYAVRYLTVLTKRDVTSTGM